jgi:hypothetical protein
MAPQNCFQYNAAARLSMHGVHSRRGEFATTFGSAEAEAIRGYQPPQWHHFASARRIRIDEGSGMLK